MEFDLGIFVQQLISPDYVKGAFLSVAVAVLALVLATVIGFIMVLDLLTSPETLAEAKAEFEAEKIRRGSVAPLLPAGFSAPIDFRWPEYIGEGEERRWWIPVSEEPWNTAAGQ